MTISVQCECGKRYKVGDDKAGKRIKCRECGGAVSIPVRDDEFDDDEYGSFAGSSYLLSFDGSNWSEDEKI